MLLELSEATCALRALPLWGVPRWEGAGGQESDARVSEPGSQLHRLQLGNVITGLLYRMYIRQLVVVVAGLLGRSSSSVCLLSSRGRLANMHVTEVASNA